MKVLGKTALAIVLGMYAIHVSGEKTVSSIRDDRAKTFADSYYRTATTVHAPLYGPLAEYIVDTYGLSDMRGLGVDIGGGPGNLVVELALRTSGMYWVNADINPYFFPYTRLLADKADVGHRVSTLRADAQDIPLKDNVADIIISRGSFQFWNDKTRAFSEIFRVLKPGGVAYIGRGFSPNLPPEIARTIRSEQGAGSPVLTYDPEKTSEELESIMKTLGIADYFITIPHPPESAGIRYGVWLEFHKPSAGRTTVPASTPATEVTQKGAEPVYVLKPLEVKGTHPRRMDRIEGQESKTVFLGPRPAIPLSRLCN